MLTVLIPCKNERLNIRACIESVRGIADEILIADSGSTDGTLDIVRSLGGCRIIEREYVNSANFKNWAIPQATHEWVLVVDADERVSPELAAEIRLVLSSPPKHDAYRLRRDNFFLGHPIRYCDWNTPELTRLFRRDLGRYQERRVHADVEIVGGTIGDLTGKLLHYTAWDLADFVAKQNRYSTWAAEDMHDKGKRHGLVVALLRFPIRFLYLYVLRLGFLDGMAGLVVCSIMAHYAFLKSAKLWALHDTIGHPDGAPAKSSRRHSSEPATTRRHAA
ncbi:MAG TPA: glycosyltransferase family 2 protein [Pirellulaceae bacterium]|nr:glycosyltransferase family 2 protein [Pirellulaceae bacterium]